MWADALPRWAELEGRIEQFLAAAGYACGRNVVVPGRSGASHEVDVLAQRSDAVTRFQVAVECKARNRPIDKETVAKLAFVVTDIGADKGILVALCGGASGAARVAADLGIELWGPGEIEDRLGAGALTALTAQPLLAPSTAAVARRCPQERARWLVDAEARGRLGLRRESVRWVREAWVAHHLVLVATTEAGRPFLGRTARRSTTRSNLYDAVTGAWWRTLDRPVGDLHGDPGQRVEPAVPAGRVSAAIRRAADRRDTSATATAWDRWAAALEALGVPGDAESVAVEGTETLYWPFWLGLVASRSAEQQRVVAVDGATASGVVCPAASGAFTAGLGHILRSLGED